MGKKLQHLLLLTMEDASDRRSWSGIPFSLRLALEQRVERLTVFRPSKPRRTPFAVLRRLIFGSGRYPLWITRATLRHTAKEVRAEIARTKPDAVLSISSQCIALLEPPSVPVFMFSDAPYLAFAEAYARWETYPAEIARFGREEAAAGRGAEGLCFGSEWACKEAARLYGLDHVTAAKRLHVTALGANWAPAQDRQEILRRVDERSRERIELLFVGRDWERKGGPLAVEVSRLLREAGHAARLHIVGCRPELGPAAESLAEIHGLLYQSDPEQSARLAELFLSCHFLLVPTLAECFGIVFAEAQAFALPPVSRAVHALPSIVEDGVTGLLFDLEATAPAYVERIIEVMADPKRYRAMAYRARQRFEEKLTWERTADGIVSAIEQLLAVEVGGEERSVDTEPSR